MTEASALVEGVEAAAQLGRNKVNLETDAEVVFSAMVKRQANKRLDLLTRR